MIFADIPQGSQVFLDANTIVYHAGADPNYGAVCKQLMERIARRGTRYGVAAVLGVMHTNTPNTPKSAGFVVNSECMPICR